MKREAMAKVGLQSAPRRGLRSPLSSQSTAAPGAARPPSNAQLAAGDLAPKAVMTVDVQDHPLLPLHTFG